MSNCPICNRDSKIEKVDTADTINLVSCESCGKFKFKRKELMGIREGLSEEKGAALKVRYALQKIITKDPEFLLTRSSYNSLVEGTTLPTPQEQLDNLIYLLGELDLDPGNPLLEFTEQHVSMVGARSLDNLGFIVEAAKEKGLVDANIIKYQSIATSYTVANIRLTINGWIAYTDLKKGKIESNQAFMAMEYGDSVLDNIYQNYFKEAVRNTGFELKRLDEGQPAGLIDDHLRVEIRKSKFLIADLTHRNNGAYWEAGYAEGLGKKVIYTCRKDVFEDSARAPHFDTNHHLTVVWEQGKLEDAAKKLKETIRISLPEDAKLEDD